MNYLKPFVLVAALLWSGALFASYEIRSETINLADYDPGYGPFTFVLESGADGSDDGNIVYVDTYASVTTSLGQSFYEGHADAANDWAQSYSAVWIYNVHQINGHWYGQNVNGQVIDLGNGILDIYGSASSSGGSANLYTEIFIF
jgi:hypothetical protein